MPGQLGLMCVFFEGLHAASTELLAQPEKQACLFFRLVSESGRLVSESGRLVSKLSQAGGA